MRVSRSLRVSPRYRPNELIPYILRPMIREDGLAVASYFKRDDGFEAIVEDPLGRTASIGTFPTIEEAEVAVAGFEPSLEDRLMRWQGCRLMAMHDRSRNKWAIYAVKNNKFQDTGVAFEKEADARRAAGG